MRSHRRFWRVMALASGMALLAAACGDDDTTSGGTTTTGGGGGGEATTTVGGGGGGEAGELAGMQGHQPRPARHGRGRGVPASGWTRAGPEPRRLRLRPRDLRQHRSSSPWPPQAAGTDGSEHAGEIVNVTKGGDEVRHLRRVPRARRGRHRHRLRRACRAPPTCPATASRSSAPYDVQVYGDDNRIDREQTDEPVGRGQRRVPEHGQRSGDGRPGPATASSPSARCCPRPATSPSSAHRRSPVPRWPSRTSTRPAASTASPSCSSKATPATPPPTPRSRPSPVSCSRTSTPSSAPRPRACRPA